MIPCPFGPALHDCNPRAFIQFDYLKLGTYSTGDKYMLMLRDDRSNYCWLFPFSDTNAEHDAHALVDCHAAFDVLKD